LEAGIRICQFVMADASVRQLNDSIANESLARLAVRDDGLPMTAP
jgi:hypothetical protein